MGAGFYIVMLAQFFSALADNALLIAAIYILQQSGASEQAPLLKFFFTISYVVLAAFVGAFADSMPKGRVMFISNTIKVFGCALMLFNVHPLLAYGIVGLGAAAYSPAKYGILTEMLPHSKLVVANGWIEGLTVGAIILGTLLGGMLIRPDLAAAVVGWGVPGLDASVASVAHVAMFLVVGLYAAAAIFNLYVPETGVDHKPLKSNPLFLIHEFAHCVTLLWRDKLGQISLAVTTLFWGAGATLQFIVLKWAEHNLELKLSAATNLQGVVAVGVAVGSILAAKMITMRRSPSVIPLGIAMGIVVNVMIFVHDYYLAMALMVLIGGLAGFFVVPMNALLQHRGHVLMGAGHSIAVQNFNENISILAMTGLYYLLLRWNVDIRIVIALFGLFVAGSMYLIKRRHEANQREFDSVSLLEDKRH
ncbi:MAG: lysophospholipid transporter LplT [Uliginosibacterium sp.]|jgi:LPLT family lysophospholipid transporter-like MFS transporter|nr:lysophospholipid transporter LplT [Uliginosibacterium sp.]MBK9392504.1 lysophospholipid transporter LplT [Uliginosibacterium sp.]MBK9615583.1 lysophospholipid transporter LplT [Uliginosibacterium sp.]